MASLPFEVLFGIYLGLLTGIVPALVAWALGFGFKYFTGVSIPGFGVVVLALAIAGASGGNVSEVLWTRIYLYQVQIFGVSHGTREEAEQLMAWIRGGQLKPVLHGAFRLSDLHRAEEYFVNRGSNYLGKIVIVPDSQWEEHGQSWSLERAR